MSTKISELPNATSLTGDEEIPIVQTGTTKKVTKQLLTNDNYSSTEQVVGTWIDGKPLYRKVLEVDTLPNATSKNIAHGISNLQQVVDVHACAYYKNNLAGGLSIPYMTTTTNFVGLYWNDTNVVIVTASDRSSMGGLIILYYTKTTDTATRTLNLMKSVNEEKTETEKETVGNVDEEQIKQNETKEPAVNDIKEETKTEGSGDVK